MNSELEARIATLSEEIRRYPTPIARCDEQLTGLLERRAQLIELLRRGIARAGGCSPTGTWHDDGGSNAA